MSKDVATKDRGIQEGVSRYSDEERARLRALQNAGDASDADLDVLHIVAQRTGLDPFNREIYLVGRLTKTGGYKGEPERWETKWSVQAGIDGFRKALFRFAESKGLPHTIGRPVYLDEEGNEYRVWPTSKGPHPYAVEIEVKVGESVGYGLATWEQYVQTTKRGEPTSMWKKMGAHMLAKCALALAIRNVCTLTSGMYMDEEMGQADNPVVQAKAQRQDKPRRSALERAKIADDTPAEEVGEPQEAEVVEESATPSPVQELTKEENDLLALTARSGDVDELRKFYRAVAGAPNEAYLQHVILGRVEELKGK